MYFFSCFPEATLKYYSPETPNAFVFSLHNNEGLPPFKIMVKTMTAAITMEKDLGPFFGGGNNINIDGHASIAKLGNSYPAPSGVGDEATILAGAKTFEPDKVEVFFKVG